MPLLSFLMSFFYNGQYFAAQHSCFQHFFEDMLSRSAENKSAKSEQFAVGFSRLWEVRIMIFGHLGGPGLILEARGLILQAWGPILKISQIFVISKTFPARKG